MGDFGMNMVNSKARAASVICTLVSGQCDGNDCALIGLGNSVLIDEGGRVRGSHQG
jgi:hypothetical protein